MNASDLRAWGRRGLKGRWMPAVLVCLVASFLTGGVDMVSEQISMELSGLAEPMAREAWTMAVAMTVVSMFLALVVGGTVQIGMCDYFRRLARKEEVRFGMVFSRFYNLWDGICLTFLQGFFIFLWSLLFVIPGIVAVYRYAMMPYLMAEFPELTARQAMNESKRIMQGHKWELFWLELSFIGWTFLCLFTMGLGALFLNPYIQASRAAFYLELTGRHEQEEPWHISE